MIEYRYPEEKQVALIFASELNDHITKIILERGTIESRDEAIHLSRFFWQMISLSAEGKVQLPFDGGTEFWTEKLYNSIGGYMNRAGFDNEWDEEIDKA